ncbi:MAG TPA: YbaK/EbsC family protein [Candidatus Nanoarchaeia archaeon]|nr:YbaK/EbsC family protein [Candidatus Nanoarchaeia archaeon]
MEENLKKYLENNNIKFKEHKHKAVFTVAQSIAEGIKFSFAHTKNLFLTDKQGNFFLFCLQAEKRAPLKKVKSLFNVKELQFASPSDLKSELNLTPGSVSIFGLINNPSVSLVLDQELYDAPGVGFHPNINTSTLELSHDNFVKFYNSLPNKKVIIEIG